MSRESMADLSGRKFDSLLVIKKTGRYISTHAVYECICECGRKKESVGYNLRQGKTRCCDFCKGIDLAGRSFLGYDVIKKIERTNSLYETYWLCKCKNCGKLKESTTRRLKNNNSKSCGCLNKGKMKSCDNVKWLGFGEISKSYWSRLQKSAEDRGFEFSITIEYMWELFLSQNRRCFYSGLPLAFANTSRSFNRGGTNASVDRIDSTKGYIVGNVQWVDKTINFMKGCTSEDKFLEKCYSITDYQRNKHGTTDS